MSLASRKLIQATAGATTVDTGDDDFANVVLLLDGDGTSGDANNTFTDSSTNGFTVTESGSVVQGSFSPYGDNWSNYFDGSDRLNLSSVTAVGTSDATIEFWFWASNETVAYRSIYDSRSTTGTDTGFGIFQYGKTIEVYGNGLKVSTAANAFNGNEWVHFALVRSSGSCQIYINGTASGSSGAYSSNLTSTARAIGDSVNSSFAYYGYISNLREDHSAVYTSGFTPSATPLANLTNTKVLTCSANRFLDESTNNYSITVTGTPKVLPFSPFERGEDRTLTTDGGSMYGDGSGDYLQVAYSSDLSTASGDFTIECWVYLKDLSVANQFFYFGDINRTPSNASGIAYGLLFFPGSGIGFGTYYGATSGFSYYSSTSIQANRWYHVSACRNGSNFYLSIDGNVESAGSFSNNLNNSTSWVLRVGKESNSIGRDINGYISDARLVKGSALYTSNFTPPTAPLTAVTNTSLLLNFQDAGIYDRTGINNLDTVGDARLGFAPIYGLRALAFDGTGDYLGIENTPELRFSSSSPFTIELWVNANALSGDQHFFWAYDPSSPYTGWALAFGANSQAATTLMWWDGTSWTNIKTGMEANRWYHIAVCSEGSASTGRFFVDGVQQGSAYTIPSTILNTTTNIRLGSQNNALYFNGYFDDVRITNGVARYTSDFTPPDEIDLSTDTHREYVTLFLAGEGPVNGQNNTFTDSSTNDFTVTESGSVVQGVFSPYGDNWSNYLNGTDYLYGTVNALGTGDFTLECWVNFSSLGANRSIMSFGSYSPSLYYRNASAELAVYHGTAFYLSGFTPEVGEWYHVAFTRSGTTSRMFVNGVQQGSNTTYSTNITDTTLRIGYDGVDYTDAYISNVRVVSGTALYTSNFTAPTSPLSAVTNTEILTCQSNRFVDNGSNSITVSVNSTPQVSRFSPFESDKPYDITTDGGSAYFDGVKTTQLYAGTSNVIPATGDFTVEGWVYFTGLNTVNSRSVFFVKDSGTTASGNRSFQILLNNNGTKYDDVSVALFQSNSSFDVSIFTHTFEFNEWYHIAVTRTGQTIECFINGTSIGTDTNTRTSINQTTEENYIASWNSSNKDDTHIGYFGDFRIVHSRVYTSNFTPPTSPLTAIANTELLLNFQDSAIPDLSGINNIDTVGNAKVAGSDPTKYGSNSLQLDGSGDYLELKNNQEVFDLGTGDFTVECWFYANALSATTYSTLFGFHNGGSSEWGSYVRSNGVFIYGSANTLTGAGTVSTSTWYHYAATRSGSTVRVFLNGTQVDTDTVSGSYTSSAIPFRVGIDGGINGYFNGFIDDLRITKGVARYTANFTPPTDALPKF